MCVWFHHFYQVSRLSLYGHTGVLGSGRSPLVIGEAHGAGQGCVPVLPLDQCYMHCRPEPGSLPQDHPGSAVVAPSLPLGQLHGISYTSPSLPSCPVAPCVVCVLGLSQLVVLATARQPPRPTQFGDFPSKDALDARLPPPASRHARSGNRSHDLPVARPTLTPVELTGDCMCVCVCVCVCVHGYYRFYQVFPVVCVCMDVCRACVRKDAAQQHPDLAPHYSDLALEH